MGWMSKFRRASEFDVAGRSTVHHGETRGYVRGDNPIQMETDDVLNRAKAASSFSNQILSLDASEGLVVGILGPWGSGKTSFINLTRPYLEQKGAIFLAFNPWMFSGAEQLVQRFFVEISSQLQARPDFADIGGLLDDYGEGLSSSLTTLPAVGPWIGLFLALTRIFKRRRRKTGVTARRDQAAKKLTACNKTVVVVIDDVDRLTSPEIREIFKLVRLTASLPNIIYIVAFDRARVELALDEQGVPGRDYLEKILQIAIDLPTLPPNVLCDQISTAINKALAKIDQPGPFNQTAWPDIFMEIILPLVRNMRDVNRYAAAIHGTVQELGDQVALVDVLALEAVRVFRPDVFRRIHECVEGLTATANHQRLDDRGQPYLKKQLDFFIRAGGDHDNIVYTLISRIFPAARWHIGVSQYGEDWKSRWLRHRRVAHEQILRLYLERVVGANLQTFTYAEQAWARMANRADLDAYLRSIAPERLQDTIAGLEAFTDQFQPEHVIPGIVVLLNLLPDLPERRHDIFDLPTSVVVGRVTYRLLKTIQYPPQLEVAVNDILPQLPSLFAKLELIEQIGGDDNRAGHELVLKSTAKRFAEQFRTEVRSADVGSLAKEKGLLRLLLFTKLGAGPTEPPLNIPDSSAITIAILRSARSEALSQTMGGRTVHRQERLEWDALVKLYGNEDVLRERLHALKASQPEGDGDLLKLADQYLGGWRPDAFADEQRDVPMN